MSTYYHSEWLDEAAMLVWARALASRLPPAAIVFLQGDLGAGKTTWTRGLLQGLGWRGAVKSPTYTLVETYTLPGGRTLHHFDLYRLSSPDELDFIGFADYCDGRAWLLLEWPERGAGCLPSPDLVVDFERRAGARRLHCQWHGRDAPPWSGLDKAEN